MITGNYYLMGNGTPVRCVARWEHSYTLHSLWSQKDFVVDRDGQGPDRATSVACEIGRPPAGSMSGPLPDLLGQAFIEGRKVKDAFYGFLAESWTTYGERKEFA